MTNRKVFWEEQDPICDMEEDRNNFSLGENAIRFYVWSEENNPLYSSDPYDPCEEKDWQAFSAQILLNLAGDSTELFHLPIVKRNEVARLRVPMSRERILHTMDEIKRYPQSMFLIPRERGHEKLPREIIDAVSLSKIDLEKILSFAKFVSLMYTDKRMIETFTSHKFLDQARQSCKNTAVSNNMKLESKIPRKVLLEGFVPIEPEQYYHFRLAGLTEQTIRHKIWVDLFSAQHQKKDETVNKLIEARWVSVAQNIIKKLSDNGRGLCCLSFPAPSQWKYGSDSPEDWNSLESKRPTLKISPDIITGMKRPLLSNSKLFKSAKHAGNQNNACPDMTELKTNIERYCRSHYEDYYFVLKIPCDIGTAERIRELVKYGRLDLEMALERCECIIAHGIEEPLLEIFSDKIKLDDLESLTKYAAREAGAELVTIKPV